MVFAIVDIISYDNLGRRIFPLSTPRKYPVFMISFCAPRLLPVLQIDYKK